MSYVMIAYLPLPYHFAMLFAQVSHFTTILQQLFIV